MPARPDSQRQHCPGRTLLCTLQAQTELSGRQTGRRRSVHCEHLFLISWTPLYHTVGHAASGHPSPSSKHRSPGWDVGPETWGLWQGSDHLRDQRVPRCELQGPRARGPQLTPGLMSTPGFALINTLPSLHCEGADEESGPRLPGQAGVQATRPPVRSGAGALREKCSPHQKTQGKPRGQCR